MKKDIKKILETKAINEGFPRLGQIMHGDVPAVKTFGIVSSYNPFPYPDRLPKKENELRNERLAKKLRLYDLGFSEVAGVYAPIGKTPSAEYSFFVRNITLETLIDLAREFEQSAVIYGEVSRGSSNVTYQWWEVTDTSKSTYLKERDKILSSSNEEPIKQGLIDNLKQGLSYELTKNSGERYSFTTHIDPIKPGHDAYTQYKGRKFHTPFFTSGAEKLKFQGGVVKEGDTKETTIVVPKEDWDKIKYVQKFAETHKWSSGSVWWSSKMKFDNYLKEIKEKYDSHVLVDLFEYASKEIENEPEE